MHISRAEFKDKLAEAILAGENVVELLYETMDTKKVSLPNPQTAGTDTQNQGYAYQAAEKITTAYWHNWIVSIRFFKV